MMWFFSSGAWFWCLVALFLVAGLMQDQARRRPVATYHTVVAVKPTPEHPAPAQKVKVQLDIVQEEAVSVLQGLGWSRRASIAALTNSGWGGPGDPSVEDMTLAALTSMPNRGMK